MPSRDFYIQCPACHQELRVRMPGRSGVIRDQWSDGFFGQEPSTFFDYASCPLCHQAFWVGDQAKLDREAEPTPRDIAIGQSIIIGSGFAGISRPFDESTLPSHGEPFVQPASISQMIAALSAADLSPDQERCLRVALWHRGNHADRGFTVTQDDRLPEEFRQDNLRHLLAEQEAKPNEDRDIVIEGELLREMGLFSAATERMAIAVGCGSTRAVAIQQQVAMRNEKVCIVREGGAMVIY